MLSQSYVKQEGTAPASSPTELERLLGGYSLFAKTEGHSAKSITIVVCSVTYLDRFLRSEGMTTDVTKMGASQIRAYILYLQNKKCCSGHRFTKPQEKGLSGHSINCYLRSVRAFWSWLVADGIIETNPFATIKIPKAPRKIINPFSSAQIGKLLGTIDPSAPQGCRDQAIILTLLDTALRLSELLGITLDDLRLEEGLIKVMGKGNKERIVPIGKRVQRALWHYINRYRPEPENPKCKLLFLTCDGMPLTKDRIEKMMAQRCRKAGIVGVRCSPHTLRHTAAISFLRNGGNAFSLQRLLGHSSLEMTRHYCDVADIDVKNAHITASPVDNLAVIPSKISCGKVKTSIAQKNQG